MYMRFICRLVYPGGTTMRILICDDDRQYVDELKKHIEEYMSSHYLDCRIEDYTSPLAAADNGAAYDIAFLDIQMDELDGLSLAEKLTLRNGKLIIFYITSYNKYQDDAMDTRAFRFFEKPFDPERLYSGLDKALEYMDRSYVDIFLYNGHAQKRIPIDDIMYAETANRRTTIVTKEDRYNTSASLDELREALPNTFFYRVHKSFIVNLHYVEKYNYTELFLADGTRIPVAPRKQADFHKYWFAYLRRR